jgi:Protein of unknown function (DUF2958)
MKLLTDELRRKLPPLYATEGVSDPPVICKFFLPATAWTWYPVEFDGTDVFFGYVVGQYTELGYFSLSELEEARGPWDLAVELDHFKVTPLSQIRRIHEPDRRTA